MTIPLGAEFSGREGLILIVWRPVEDEAPSTNSMAGFSVASDAVPEVSESLGQRAGETVSAGVLCWS